MKKDTMISVNFDSFKALSDEELARIIGLATCALSMRNAVASPIQPEPETVKTHKVSEAETVSPKKGESPAYLLRDGKIVYKNPDVVIWKKTRWAMTQSAIEAGGQKLTKGEVYDRLHDADMYTLVFSFDKIADAKSFMEGQEQYRK